MFYITEMLVPISFFAAMVLVVYLFLKYNYQLKKALIDQGGNIEFPKRKSLFLEIGFTVLGFGLGLVIGALLQSTSLNPESKIILIGACSLFFSGCGAVLGFFIRQKIDAANKN